jgi:predicted O-methyltransferase YrrM|tara:strand:+ start:1540 stop:2316 length:777 start_codon:yes stop_codon:yes gene_type:complete
MITRKLKKLLYLLKNNKKSFLKEQIILFDKFNLNRENGKELLNNIKKQYPILNTTMNSEHQTIFSSISENKKYVIKNILEIGTYDGTNAFLLSKLFPQAKILTIDLPDDAKDFQDTYGRNDEIKRENFIKLRNQVINTEKNIKFKQFNSLKLTFENEKFDLIWVDGAHGYPQVTIDIINSLRLCNQNGLILCDDIFKYKIKNQDEMYYSNATIETIKLLASEKIVSYDLFLKRIENKYNYFPQEQKFIGLIKFLKEKK